MFLNKIRGECLYSLVARHHLASPFRSLREKNQALFGRQYIKINQQLPCMIEKVAKTFSADTDELLMYGTAFPLVASTLNHNTDKEHLRESMLSNSGSRIATLSRTSSSKLHFNRIMKYCPICLAEDIDHYGCGIWYTQLQLHGVSVCPVHHCWLTEASVDEDALNKRFELPPTAFDIQQYEQVPVLDSAIRLSSFIYEWHELTQERAELHIEQAHRYWIALRGYEASKGHIRSQQLKEELCECWQSLFNQYPPLIPLTLKHFSFLHSLTKVGNHHYLKHALLAAYFCDSPYKYFNKVEKKKPLVSTQAKHAAVDVDVDVIVKQLKDKQSLRSVALATGHSVGYIQSIADREDIPIQHRRKRLNRDDIDKMTRLAFRGVHRKDIANICKVSVSKVEQQINAVKGLARWRHKLKFLNKRNNCRSNLKAYVHANIGVTRNQVRLNNSVSNYNWLFRNDKNWLMQHLPDRLPHCYRAETDWHNLDMSIANEICNTIHFAKSISHVDRQLGDRPSLIKNRKKLPKSIQAATKVVKACR